MIKVINVHRDARYKGFSQFVKVCCLLSPLFPSLMWPYPSFVTYHLWATNCALCGPNLSWDGLKKEARILNIKKTSSSLIYFGILVCHLCGISLCKMFVLKRLTYCIIYWDYHWSLNSMFMYILTTATISVKHYCFNILCVRALLLLSFL